MNNIERRDKELAYISDEMVLGEQAKCRKVLQKLNFMDRSDFAGSVVTKDIPDWCVAVGNPCRVKRLITDADKRKLFKDEEIDEEAWNDIVDRGFDMV